MNSYIQKIVGELQSQIADYETIDLIISKIEELGSDEYSDLYKREYNGDYNKPPTVALVNPRTPQIIEEIIGAIREFYMLTEPPKELHEDAIAPDAGKHDTLIITPKEA